MSDIDYKKERTKKNKYWDKNLRPFFTIMTPVYNRRSTIQRTLNSVNKQEFKDIEYIIIDDGSTESIDDIVQEFMNSTKIPVMFIKKTNGGVHTARNMGYRYARGQLILCIDSDDELLPEACKIFHKTWLSIPKGDRGSYWQIKAQCIDQNGKITGTLFPDGINEMSNEKARKSFSMAKGEQIGCRVAKIMKKNMFPEPDGVTFVTENVKWVPLERRYKSWGVNDIVRVYHREGDDHLSAKSKRKTKQDLKNIFWNLMHQLNNASMFDLKYFLRIKLICKYCVIKHLLIRLNEKKFVQKYNLGGVFNCCWEMLLWVPSFAVAKVWYWKIGINK